MTSLHHKNFTKLLDYTPQEITFLLNLAKECKKQKQAGVISHPLAGKSIALLFQKDSTRTRCAFEVAAADLGIKTVYLGPSGTQFGKKESVEDSAKVLGRMFQGIQFRGYQQSDVELLALHAGVPVWNGLTDQWHPTQMIADLMTIQEVKGPNLAHKKIVFVGDGRNNVANSLLISTLKMGMDFVVLAPQALHPTPELIKHAQDLVQLHGGSYHAYTIANQTQALANADVVYTDVWVSMGEENWTKRLEQLHQYQVNTAMLKLAAPDVIFLHCLPALHNLETTISKTQAQKYRARFPTVKNGEFEVSDAVIKAANSYVFQQAENRLHSIKAIILATMR